MRTRGVHPNFVVAHRLWDAIADGDAKALRAVLAEKCVWRMCGTSPLAGVYVGPENVYSLFAEAGERCDDLRADLLDIFVSARGAVVRYEIWAQRGSHVLEIEHLLLTRIEGGRIIEATFAPIDQEKYDGFWIA